MAAEASEIVIICAADGREWAVFIQRKLSSAEYNIKTRTEDFKEVKLRSLSGFKVQVVLLSPQLLDGTQGNRDWDFELFDKSSTVMILLGLGVQDIREQLGPKSEFVFQCHHETIHQNDPGKSLANALVEIIKVYERDESFEEDMIEEDAIYQYPPAPRQINKIYRVIPPPEGAAISGETLVMLDRPADGDVMVELQSSVKLHAKFLDKAVYSVKLPESSKGTVAVKVTCKDQVIDEDSITVQSKLNQLRSLLQDITNPMSLMCQALGLDGSSSETLDTALASQIKKQWSPQSMQIFQIFEANITEERSTHEWPTFPHFIAEFNLVKTCAKLLKFPSTAMIMSCCYENCNGDYPCEIADRKGYHDLADQLTKVVEEYGKKVDSGVVTESDFPPPAPHLTALLYVNQKRQDAESPYMDMSQINKVIPEVPLACKKSKLKDHRRMPPRSLSDGDTRPRISFMNPEYSPTSSNWEETEGSEPRPPLHPVSEVSAEEMSSSPESGSELTKTVMSSPPPFLPAKKPPVAPPKPKISAKQDIGSSSSSTGPAATSTSFPRPQTLPRSVSTPVSNTTDEQSSSDDTDYDTPKDLTIPAEALARRLQESKEKDSQRSSVASPEDTHLVEELFKNIAVRERSESEPTERLYHHGDNNPLSEDEEANSRMAESLGLSINEAYHSPGEPSLRGKTTRSRISSFLSRFRKKKQTTESEGHRSEKKTKKTLFYGRQGRGSDPGLSGMSFPNYQRAMGKNSMSMPRKMSLPAVLEPPEARDSGSYSEEEEGSTDTEKISYRKKASKLSLTGKRQSLERKKSVRLSRALNETISDAPSMPQTKTRPRYLSASSAT